MKVIKTTLGIYNKNCTNCFGTGVFENPETGDIEQCTCNIKSVSIGKGSHKEEKENEEE